MIISTDQWVGTDDFTRATVNAHEYTLHEWYPTANTTARAQMVTDLGTAGVTISGSNPARNYRADASTGAEHEVSEDGSTWRSIPSQDAWTTLTLDANWTLESGYANVRYSRLGLQVLVQGSVLVRTGATLAVTPGNFYTVATIPSGYRPAAQVAAGGACGVAANLGAAQWRVTTAGVLAFSPYVTGGTIATGGGAGNSVVMPTFVFEAA